LFAILFTIIPLWFVAALSVHWFAKLLGAGSETAELLGISLGVLAALTYTLLWVKWRRRGPRQPHAL
jgi:hypothetical protein